MGKRVIFGKSTNFCLFITAVILGSNCEHGSNGTDPSFIKIFVPLAGGSFTSSTSVAPSAG
jgi:hypothetical protein